MTNHPTQSTPVPTPTPKPNPTGWQVSMRRPRGFTLLEALIASIIVSMVAATASMSVAVGSSIEQQNRLSVLAMQAAELQMSSVLEQSYETMNTLAGTEAVGQLLAPKRPGAATRGLLPATFSELSRVTTIVTENRTLTQYNNYTVSGKRIDVTVIGPNGLTLARLVRFRGADPTT
jgi:prepilin-type N-terminal cleavage/methylation domain-containing protein